MSASSDPAGGLRARPQSVRPRRARSCRSDRRHRARHVRLLLARQPHAVESTTTARITLLWSAIFIVVSVLYRPVEQLLSRTIADRDARGQHRQRAPARGGDDPARARRCCSLVVALVLRGPLAGRPVRRLRDALLDPDRRGARATRRATSRAASSPGTGGSGSTAGSCSWRPCRAACSRCSRWRSAIVVGPAVGRAGHGGGAARCRLSVVPWALGRHVRARAGADARDAGTGALDAAGAPTSRPAASRSSRSRTAPGSPRRCSLIMICEQTFLQRRPAAREGDGGPARRRARRLRVQRAADRPRAAAAVPGDPDLDPAPPHAAARRPARPTRSAAACRRHAEGGRRLRRRAWRWRCSRSALS